MAKDTFYFSHDYNSRNDSKIKKLISKHGLLGYGLFWAIIEDLYNNTNVLPTDYECIAFDMRVEESLVTSVINDFDLFIVSDGFFGSQSVERRLNERNDKSTKARESVLKRWLKCEIHTNVLRSKCECNTIKESKGEEKKGEEIKLNKEEKIANEKKEFGNSLKSFIPKYGEQMLRDFFTYWSEPNQAKTKLKFQMQKTWELSGRLQTWKRLSEKNNIKNGTTKITTIERTALAVSEVINNRRNATGLDN